MCLSLSLLANSGAQSSFLVRFLLLPMIRSTLTNMHEMEKLLQKTDDVNWTVVRPPGLKNLPASGRITHTGCICQALRYKRDNAPFLSGVSVQSAESCFGAAGEPLIRIQFHRHGCWCVTFSVLLHYFLGRLYPPSWSAQDDPSFNYPVHICAVLHMEVKH